MQSATVLVPSGINVSASACTITPQTTFDGEIIINNGLRHSYGTAITAQVAATQYTLTTYRVDTTALPSWSLLAGEPGQEITVIAEGGQLTLPTSGIISLTVGATGPILVNQDCNITLRYIGALWHVVSSSPSGVSGY